MANCAIVGAGVAGLGAAWALRDDPLTVTVLEKSRGYSGRAATRGRAGTRYDHGANYLQTRSERVRRVVCEELPTDQLEDINRDLWVFDAEGTLQPGDPESNARPKWTYRDGISTLGKLLAQESEATVQHRTRVERLVREEEAWHLQDTEGRSFGAYEAVLLTPPAPQTADILRASTMDTSVKHSLVQALEAVPYLSQFTAVLHYDHPVDRPGDFYGLLNTDRKHDVAWLAFENDKPDHVPDGETLLIVQMAPHWSEAHLDASSEAVIDAAAQKASALLDTDLTNPTWSDTQRWRYALPTEEVDQAALKSAQDRGLFFAGDLLLGKGRVGGALETGLDAAAAIRRHLE